MPDDQLVSRFVELTHTTPEQAVFYLEASGDNFERALQMYFGERPVVPLALVIAALHPYMAPQAVPIPQSHAPVTCSTPPGLFGSPLQSNTSSTILCRLPTASAHTHPMFLPGRAPRQQTTTRPGRRGAAAGR